MEKRMERMRQEMLNAKMGSVKLMCRVEDCGVDVKKCGSTLVKVEDIE